MTRVLVIEDNVDLRESLVTFLEAEDFKVFASASVEEAEQYLNPVSFDIALIDINLPGRSGFSFLKEVRSIDQQVPLIALTARDGIDDKVRGFETGLTDYVVKPFSLAELTARMRAHLRLKSQQQDELATKHFTLLPERREVLVAGKAVGLTGTEFRLLYSLARQNGRIVSFDDLIADAWGEADRYSDPPLRIHIRNLRRKIGDDELRLIRTVTGTGYMLDDTK